MAHEVVQLSTWGIRAIVVGGKYFVPPATLHTDDGRGRDTDISVPAARCGAEHPLPARWK